MRCHFDVLFTPVTKLHVGLAMRSHSLFAEASYSSRLGGLCPDQSSVIDSETDLRHRALMYGKGRGSLKVGPKHTCYPEPDVGDRYRTSPVEGEDRTSVVRMM